MKTALRMALAAWALSSWSALAQTPAAPATRPPGLTLTTTAFEDGGIIPNKYTQSSPAGTAVSPPLAWTNTPAGTVSYVLFLFDPDAPVMKSTSNILHWMAFNIPAATHSLPEGVPAGQAALADGTTQGLNFRRNVGYMGMAAGANGPYHHYTFELVALDSKLSLPPDASRKDVEAAMDGHVLGIGILVGRFRRPQ